MTSFTNIIMKKQALLLSLLLFFSLSANAQAFETAVIGFYNVENLFDTLDSPDTWDTEFTPSGKRRYDSNIYYDKLQRLAGVISEIGTEVSPDGPAILGLAEVENRAVLEDLVTQKALTPRNYQIIHFDSPDFRGIDVALLYQPKYFEPTAARAVPLKIYNDDGSPRVTRDILFVSGNFMGETLHILVNHWPSRRGGQSATQAYRNAGAAVCKRIVDSLTQTDPHAQIIIMGDLNDDPASPSVKKILQAKKKASQVKEGELFNALYEHYQKGFGTLAWRDSWNLFDQLIVSHGLMEKEGFFFYKAKVFRKDYLLQKTGTYKGYPKRTFSGDEYIHGYSDHLPVYLILLREKKE